MTNNIERFEKQNYLNLETFRKNGTGVKTPVWFVLEDNTLLIWTEIGSGKVKRIRRNDKVRVVPSNASGAPIGEWLDAQANADDSTESLNHVIGKFKRKYGILFTLFAMLNRKAQFTVVKIRLT